MPLITRSYDSKRGAYLDVFLSKPKSFTFRESEIEESTRKLTMLIDSGASRTAISSEIALQMGLLPVGKTPLKSVTNEVLANIFYVDLRCDLFSPGLVMEDVTVVEFGLGRGWIDGILGRDFLEKMVFCVNGPEKTFSVGY